MWDDIVINFEGIGRLVDMVRGVGVVLDIRSFSGVYAVVATITQKGSVDGLG
jgi:hypothetical protein